MSSNNFPTCRFSLVIPAYNEERLLPGLLETIVVARERYRYGADAIQVIIADNGSIDTTAAIAESYGCEVVRVEERRIASVRNGGARHAAGEILSFVDADTKVHPETFNAIDDALKTGRVVAGATGVRLDRMSPGIAATYALLIPFVWAMRMDTGVVFCRRDDFEEIGGYDERRSFGEDVQLLFDLKRVGRKRGQKLIRLRAVKAVASTRKFDSFGDWHYFTELRRLLPLMVRSPEATSEFAERFWYGDQRPPLDPSKRNKDRQT
jgi:glycosyltransferase involved in cell wall biosynthesis